MGNQGKPEKSRKTSEIKKILESADYTTSQATLGRRKHVSPVIPNFLPME